MTTDKELEDASTALQLRKAIGLLTEDEVAKALLLNSINTLATWRSQKKGPPFVKLGKRVFYTQQDFVQWVIAERECQMATTTNKPAGMVA
jgi:hypothetical protein